MIPGLGRSPGEGNGDQLQYCLGNPTDRGARQAAVHAVSSRTLQIARQRKMFPAAPEWESCPGISRCHLTTPGPAFMNRYTAISGSPWAILPSCAADTGAPLINSPSNLKLHFPKEKSHCGRQNPIYPSRQHLIQIACSQVH